MKRAMQALLIAPDPEVILAVITGYKDVSIREGHRDYQVGAPIMIGCAEGEPFVVIATVTEVTHTTLADVPVKDLRDDGYRDHKHMFDDLRRYYPNLTLNSDVTIIRWGDVTGDMAEELFVVEYAEKHGLSGYI